MRGVDVFLGEPWHEDHQAQVIGAVAFQRSEAEAGDVWWQWKPVNVP